MTWIATSLSLLAMTWIPKPTKFFTTCYQLPLIQKNIQNFLQKMNSLKSGLLFVFLKNIAIFARFWYRYRHLHKYLYKVFAVYKKSIYCQIFINYELVYREISIFLYIKYNKRQYIPLFFQNKIIEIKK